MEVIAVTLAWTTIGCDQPDWRSAFGGLPLPRPHHCCRPGSRRNAAAGHESLLHEDDRFCSRRGRKSDKALSADSGSTIPMLRRLRFGAQSHTGQQRLFCFFTPVWPGGGRDYHARERSIGSAARPTTAFLSLVKATARGTSRGRTGKTQRGEL